MHLKTRNINTAFHGMVRVFNINTEFDNIVNESSRNGSVLRIDEPVTITYEQPLERVLFNNARDANPFALLYEALWMLAGRNDVAPLAFYTKQFNEYSDDGRTLNGAYGYRWRHSYAHDQAAYEKEPSSRACMMQEIDQLDTVVAHLTKMPESRRAVLQMWNVEDDLLKIGGLGFRTNCRICHGRGGVVRRNKVTGEIHGRLSYNDELVTCPGCNGTAWCDEPASKDVCCNLNVMLQLRRTWPQKDEPGEDTFLDITVTNRSNDLVWGLLGANYVTFSILQEYLAARLGVGVGWYHHVSNNLHVYTDGLSGFKPAEWLAADEEQPFGFHVANPDDWAAQYRKWTQVPLVNDAGVFDKEVKEFVEQFSGKKQVEDLADYWTEPFLHDVAQPMMVAWACHKVKDYHGAFACCAGIEATDWRLACEQWLRKRAQNHETKKALKEGEAGDAKSH